MDRVIICGFGHVGYQIFNLLNRLKITGTIITNEKNPDRIEEAESAGFKVIFGDASDFITLKKADVESAKVIFAVTDSDLTNLSILSDTQKLNAKTRLVIRLFDKLLSEELLKTQIAHSFLSTTEIAAPLFLRKILNTESGKIIAVSRHEDRILLAKENSDGSIDFSLNTPPPIQNVRRTKGTLGVLVKGVLKARSFILMMLLLAITGVLIGLIGLKLNIVDSFYFFATTVTTTGYGDINFLNSSTSTKILGSFFILWGATSMAILFSILTDTLLKQRLQGLLPASNYPNKNHIILVGANRLTQRLYTLLKTLGTPTVIVKTSEDNLEQSNFPHDAICASGDPRDPQLLESINLHQGLGIISCTANDVVNLGSCVLAKKLNSKILTISRVYDSFLANKLQDTLNIDDVGSISLYSSSYFVAHAIKTNVIAAFEKDNHLIILSDAHSEPNSKYFLSPNSNLKTVKVDDLTLLMESFPLS